MSSPSRPPRRPVARGRLGLTVGAALGLLLGCLLFCGGCASADPRITQLIAPVDEALLRSHVQAQVDAGPHNWEQPEAQAVVRAWLHAELAALGWESRDEVFEAPVQIRHPIRETKADGTEAIVGFDFEYPLREHRNVLAEKRGAVRPDHVVEVVAHYDTVRQSRGADDNASGVAGLLEIARVLAEVQTRDTVRLCFTAMEEDGLDGARAHVANLLAELDDPDEQFGGALVLDPIGYTDHSPDSQDTPVRIWFIADPPTTGDFILLVGNWDSGALADDVQSVIERYTPELPLYALERLGGFFEDAARSDHKPYWDAGLPAVWLNDFADGRSPHYHRPSDLPDTLDYVFMAKVTRASAAWVLERAGLAEDAGE